MKVVYFVQFYDVTCVSKYLCPQLNPKNVWVKTTHQYQSWQNSSPETLDSVTFCCFLFSVSVVVVVVFFKNADPVVRLHSWSAPGGGGFGFFLNIVKYGGKANYYLKSYSDIS